MDISSNTIYLTEAVSLQAYESTTVKAFSPYGIFKDQNVFMANQLYESPRIIIRSGMPFVVRGPSSTFDLSIFNGEGHPIILPDTISLGNLIAIEKKDWIDHLVQRLSPNHPLEQALSRPTVGHAVVISSNVVLSLSCQLKPGDTTIVVLDSTVNPGTSFQYRPSCLFIGPSTITAWTTETHIDVGQDQDHSQESSCLRRYHSAGRMLFRAGLLSLPSYNHGSGSHHPSPVLPRS